MDVATRFAQALEAEARSPDGSDPLPFRLTRAAAAVLPVHGVGLSVHAGPDLRVPVAASSEVATIAEGLQFTAGEGPCLLVAALGVPVAATEDHLREKWPAFHGMLVARTPLRSVLALPLPAPLAGLAVMDLYCTDAAGATAVDVAEALVTGRLFAERLGAEADWSIHPPLLTPTWVNSPQALRRGRLWRAVGMVTGALGVPGLDALDLMRGYAYATDRTVDDLAADLLARRIDPFRLDGQAGTGG